MSYKQSIRIAFLLSLWRQGHTIAADELAALTGAGLRSAQRDIKAAKLILPQVEHLVTLYLHPAPKDKLYDVDEVADILKLNAYHVRLLARNLNIGKKIKREWRFTRDELKMLKKRPHAKHKRKAKNASVAL